MSDTTLFEKIWESHVVDERPGEPALLYIDLHLVHEVTSPQAFESLRLAGRPVRRPDLTIATMDHNVPTELGPIRDPLAKAQLDALAANCAEFGVPLNATGSGSEGIVHVMGPELGLTQPGMTIVCGDSHTSTHGAFGALAFGIGTSEVEHVLATQTLIQSRPKTMRIRFVGDLPFGVTAKDMVLGAIGRIGVAGGVGYTIEFAGPAVEALSMEGRMTICNMTIEGGARAGMIAPDDTTFAYIEGRPGAPKGAAWEQALDAWRGLRSDPGATFDREVEIDVAELVPQVTWGTNPGHGRPDLEHGSGSGVLRRPGRAPRRRARARLHGPRARDAARGDPDRPRLHRLVHELADRGSARRGRGRLRPAGRKLRPRDGRPWLGQGEAPGRERGPRPGLQERRLRMARGGLLDVPRHEPRHPRRGRALRLDLEPQLRGAPGRGWSHASPEPADGGRGRHRRATSPT